MLVYDEKWAPLAAASAPRGSRGKTLVGVVASFYTTVADFSYTYFCD